jgi:hypothetical protein
MNICMKGEGCPRSAIMTEMQREHETRVINNKRVTLSHRFGCGSKFGASAVRGKLFLGAGNRLSQDYTETLTATVTQPSWQSMAAVVWLGRFISPDNVPAENTRPCLLRCSLFLQGIGSTYMLHALANKCICIMHPRRPRCKLNLRDTFRRNLASSLIRNIRSLRDSRLVRFSIRHVA